MPQSIIFTKNGFEELKKERAQLLEKRIDAVNALQKARELGDLSENGAYKAARFELSGIDGRLRKIDRLIRFAKIVAETQSGVVGIDTKVTVNDGTNTQVFHLVGGYESNPIEGKISHFSPIGKALLGKRVGESVAVNIPKGKVTYKILSIETLTNR